MKTKKENNIVDIVLSDLKEIIISLYNWKYKEGMFSVNLCLKLPIDNNLCIKDCFRDKNVEIFGEYLTKQWGIIDGDKKYCIKRKHYSSKSYYEIFKRIDKDIIDIYYTLAWVVYKYHKNNNNLPDDKEISIVDY